MLLRFTKMQALGNDFVVLDGVSQAITITPELIKHLANRRSGVGCDQVLLIEPPGDPKADFKYRIFNADGVKVGQCGNGARCVAKLIIDHQLAHKRELTLQLQSGEIKVRVISEGSFSVNMGRPVLELDSIPFLAGWQSTTAVYSMTIGRKSERISVLSIGNPHAVLRVKDLKNIQVELIGKEINNHDRFPTGCNVSFMEVIAFNEINLRVFERGVGETPACGSAACAAVIAGQLLGLLDNHVKVVLPGGALSISWQGGLSDDVTMIGPATKVFEGHIKY